jgi:hypothetical protein
VSTQISPAFDMFGWKILVSMVPVRGDQLGPFGEASSDAEARSNNEAKAVTHISVGRWGTLAQS